MADDRMEERLTDRELLVALWRDTKNICANQEKALIGQKQIIMALIGIIAATVGVKFLGTPPLIHATVFLSWIAGSCLVGSLILAWKHFRWSVRAGILSFAVLVWFSVIVRTFISPYGSIAPEWYRPAIDSLFLLVSAALLWGAWTLTHLALIKKSKNNGPGCK